MAYVPYKTAQQWKDANGANASDQQMMLTDWLGKLTPETSYIPYNTSSEWKEKSTTDQNQDNQILNDILGET